MLNELYYAHEVEHQALLDQQQALLSASHALESHILISTHLLHLEKVYKKVHLKEFRLIKQSLHKLKEEKAKIGSGQVEGETAYTPAVDPLGPLVNSSPLTNEFHLNPFFPFLPNLLSYNTP